MVTKYTPNGCSPSTHLGALRAKMERSTEESQRPARSKAERPGRLPRRDPRQRLTLTVTFHGGSEAWWKLEARGREWRFPGHLCLAEALLRVNGGA